jgi:hypothetical protein
MECLLLLVVKWEGNGSEMYCFGAPGSLPELEGGNAAAGSTLAIRLDFSLKDTKSA